MLYIAYTTYTPYTAYNIMWLAYHSSLHSSTGFILDYTYINQLASADSSPSSRNIVLKASIIYYLVNHFVLKAWGKQIKDSKASKEEPSAPLTIRLSTKNGATGGSSSSGSRGGG